MAAPSPGPDAGPGGAVRRRAKLVCSLGPATSTAERVRALVGAGMDVARINLSHGSAEEHAAALRLVRSVAEESGRVVAAMSDLSGPKVRLGVLPDEGIELEVGAAFALRADAGPGDERGVGTTHPRLASDLVSGDRVLLADGRVELEVERVADGSATTRVVRGGWVGTRSGVSAPAERLSLAAITDKDRRDLDRVLDLGFDLVAQSFVRSLDDVRELRGLMGERRIPIVAKIENRPAVERAEQIAEAADGLMVARGDLGVETPLEELPLLQKELVRLCRTKACPSIVATQMLESMLVAPRPTRAEVSDVANAVLDGADALLLSGETAVGDHPIEAARTAVGVIEAAESRGRAFATTFSPADTGDEGWAVARAACTLTRQRIDVAAIACFARTGRTVRLVASERPAVPIFAFCPDPGVARALGLVWGVTPIPSPPPVDVDDLIVQIDREVLARGLLPAGRLVVLLGADPPDRAHTNLVKVHRLGSLRPGDREGPAG